MCRIAPTTLEVGVVFTNPILHFVVELFCVAIKRQTLQRNVLVVFAFDPVHIASKNVAYKTKRVVSVFVLKCADRGFLSRSLLLIK